MAAPEARTPSAIPAWMRVLARRIATLWPVKMVGTIVWVAGFFWLYFWVMRHPAPGTVAHVMPVTPIDRLFDVHESAVVPYASLWFYVALAPAMSRDGADLRAYARSAMALCVGGLACFWAFPTAVPSFAVDWHDYPSLAFLKSQDGGTNAFPSLHVAFAVHSALFIRQALREVGATRLVHALNVGWCLVVIWSVFATRQHVFVDVVGGVAAGFASLALAWRPRERPAASAVPGPGG